MTKKIQNMFFPVLIILCCAFLWNETNLIPDPRFEPLGAAFFPRLNLIIISLLSVILLCNNFLSENNKEEKDAGRFDLKVYLRMLIVLAILIAYVALISFTDLSYLCLTFAYLFIFAWFLGDWKLKLILPLLCASAIVTALIYGIFGYFLEVFFP